MSNEVVVKKLVIESKKKILCICNREIIEKIVLPVVWIMFPLKKKD